MARILAADDEGDILRLIRRTLEPAGHEVTTAVDGHEALKLGLSAPFDLYIFDVKMPRLDGYSLCLSVRKKFPDRPVVLITALDVQKYEVMVKACGATAHLMKPFDGPRLLAAVSALLPK